MNARPSSFENHLPRRVSTGRGASESLVDLCHTNGLQRVFLVSNTGVAGAGLLRKTSPPLADAHLLGDPYTDALPEPPNELMDKIAPEGGEIAHMNPLANNHEDLFDLFDRAAHETLSEKEELNLQQALKEDTSARLLWFELNDVECGLAELLAHPRIRGRKDDVWNKNPQQLMCDLLPSLTPEGRA